GCQAVVTLRAPEVEENCGLKGPPTYSVSGATTIGVQSFPASADSVLEVFNAGISEVTYVVEDLSGNVDSCTFTVSVTDTVPPAAACQDVLVYVHPAGNVPLILDPALIDGGSEDNCGIDSISVAPGIFSCGEAGTEQLVQLFVTDGSGNTDSCQAIVRIEVAPLMPSFEVGICENDTLKLFANVPDAPGNPYTFSWSGPQNFVSNLENPVIPGAGAAASGTYILVVTGLGGCTSMGSVAVVIEDINAPDISADANTVCLGDPVILQASGFNQPVTYKWYRGTPPDGLLLGTSANPTFIDIPPVEGDYSYYVIVESADCTSNPSQSVFVAVVTAPEAMVNDLFLEVCVGESIVLGTEVSGPGISYQWTGPNGFSSSDQFPPVITDAQEENEGVYHLVVMLGDCMSDEASTVVIVDPRPDKPVISGDPSYCEGGVLTLVVNNVEDADQYIWNHPNGSSIPTLGNALTLSGIDEEVEGPWTVTAILNDCASETSDPFSVNVEESLIITTSNTGPVCFGDSVTLLVQIIPGATYAWTGPGGFASNEPNPTLLAVEGNYQLEVVSQTGCDASSSTFVDVNLAPEITALSNTSGLCADGTQNLSFAVTLFPEDDGSYTYSWSGPGFTSPDSNPVIPNLTSAQNGVYALVVFQGSCPSDTAFTEVDVTDSPSKPVISGTFNWCVGDDLTLSTGDYAGDSVMYTWTTPLGVIEVFNDSNLVISNILGGGAGSYSVVVTVDGCPSVTSDPVMITINNGLAPPVIQGTAVVCEGDSLILTAATVNGATYHWSGPGGFTSNAQTVEIFPAGPMDAGDYSLYIEQGPCTSPDAVPFTVEVRPKPIEPQIEPYSGSICLDDPAVFTICLDETSVTPNALYTWLVGGTDTLEGLTTQVCIDVEDVSGFTSGLNEITVIAEQNGCASAESQPLVIEAIHFPDETANAGPDRTYCLGDPVALAAGQPALGEGQWSALDAGIVFADPSDPQTSITGLQEGVNKLIWSLDFASCIGYSSDTVEILVEPSPLLGADSVFTEFGMTIDIEVLANDLLPGGIMSGIIELPAHGNALMNSSGIVIYTPNLGYVGSDILRYEVCSAQCPAQCDETVVVIQVGDENDCFVPTIFTPNQDGVNDLLTIPCLETDRFPGNRVAVYNVWGDAVFEAAPYENDWDGTRDGKELPVGTYYYIVDFGDNSPL
ncbi:MAG: gliding motility-associated C-terminal domain-containing protein, partial [Saprospiraceae bacterium]|nr:gliding motility-associated C-terminal domain-containing protein [Saprospiraceae bacterium]